MKIVDLSLPLHTGMPVYPGDPEASIEPVHTLAHEGWVLRRLEINSHDGTHVNVPAHMIAGGKNLDDYAPDDFCGRARLYRTGTEIEPGIGYLFDDRTIDAVLAEQLVAGRPRFVGLAGDHGLEVEIQRALLAAGIIVFENLINLDRLPEECQFYGMPLRIRDGDGSPVRAFAVIG